MATLAVTNTLNSLERTELRNAESVIERHVGAFLEVGRALTDIRDKRLYREEHKTFEAYVKAKWDFKKDYAYRLIAASVVMENVDNCQQKPATEAQARPLVSLPAEEQPVAWQAAVERAEEQGKPITAAIVAEVVEEMKAPESVPSDNGDAPDVATSVLLAKNSDKIKPTHDQLVKLAAMTEKQQDAIMRAVDGGKTLSQAMKDAATPKDSKGKPIPPALREAWEKTKQLDEWSRQLSKMLREVKAFAEDRSVGAYMDMLTFDRDIRNCKHALKFAKPYVVCHVCKGDGCTTCRNTGWLPQTTLTRNSDLSEEAAA